MREGGLRRAALDGSVSRTYIAEPDISRIKTSDAGFIRPIISQLDTPSP
jgi:hypothetical protein